MGLSFMVVASEGEKIVFAHVHLLVDFILFGDQGTLFLVVPLRVHILLGLVLSSCVSDQMLFFLVLMAVAVTRPRRFPRRPWLVPPEG